MDNPQTPFLEKSAGLFVFSGGSNTGIIVPLVMPADTLTNKIMHAGGER
jgi:hypothetical protein